MYFICSITGLKLVSLLFVLPLFVWMVHWFGWMASVTGDASTLGRMAFLLPKRQLCNREMGSYFSCRTSCCQLEMGFIWFSYSYCPASPMPTYHSVSSTVSKREGRPAVSWEEALPGKETMSNQYWESMNCSYSFFLGPHDCTLQYIFQHILFPLIPFSHHVKKPIHVGIKTKHSHEHQL